MSNLNQVATVMVTLSSVWVYWDATNKKIGKILSQKSFTNMSAGAWAISTLCLWIIAFPTYLLKRKVLLEKASTNPVSVKSRNIKFGVLCLIALFPIIALYQSIFIVNIDTPIAGDQAKLEKAFADFEKRLGSAHPELNAQLAYGACTMIAIKEPNEGNTLREYMLNCWSGQLKESEQKQISLEQEQKKYLAAVPLLRLVSLNDIRIEFAKGGFMGDHKIPVIHATVKNDTKELLSSASFQVQLFFGKKTEVVAAKNLLTNFESEGGLKPSESKEVVFNLDSFSDDDKWKTLEIELATDRRLVSTTTELKDAGNRSLAPHDLTKELEDRTNDVNIKKINLDVYKNL